jgi:hypothetical protein
MQTLAYPFYAFLRMYLILCVPDEGYSRVSSTNETDFHI